MEAVRRRWTYAAPPWRFRQALVDELAGWLPPDHGVAAHVDDNAGRVVLRPWPDSEVDEVHVEVEPHGPGTRLTVVVHAPAPLPEPVRYRVSEAFGAELRHHVDGW